MPNHFFSDFEWPSFRPPLETYKLDYGIGIVGYAGIVRAQHLPAYRLAGYRVVAAADIRADRRELAKLDGIPHVYEDYRELLQPRRRGHYRLRRGPFGHGGARRRS